MAGALREQPKGQDPPRKAGTGASAVIRHRRFGAIPLHDGSVTVRYGTITVPLQFPYGSFTVCYALLRLCYGAVPTPAEIRLISVTMPRSPSGSSDLFSHRGVMDYRLRSLRRCLYCASRLPPAMRIHARYCSVRCRMAAHRAARAKRSDGTDPQAGPDPVAESPGWHRQEAEGALLRLAGEAVEVIADALVRNDTSVAEWIVERSVVRHSKPGSPPRKVSPDEG